MTSELESNFRELGLAQYLDSFVDQGFDTWDTILDIQESDLDALGVKLGHRRKLQRRIANARGIAPSISLSSPKQNGEAKRDGSRSGQGRGEPNGDGTGVVKRKYRRHPKPDENAPERPPSAYVLFSNKMREDLKGHNLTFTEIAKLVGENWQSLPPGEKEAYESQANTAKEKYHRDLVEYKKTPEYRKYAQYLQEFKEKQAKQNQDANKRPKVEPARLRHGSTSSSAATNGTMSSGSAVSHDSRSSSERIQGSEPPPSLDRVNSAGSSPGDAPRLPSMDDSRVTPPRGFEMAGGRDQSLRNVPMRDAGANGARHPLPSLSDIMDDGRSSNPASSPRDASFPRSSFAPAGGPPMSMERPSIVPPAMRAPMLRPEDSSAASSGSAGSTTSTGSFARQSSDGPLPIHALLTNRSVPVPSHSPSMSPTFPPNGPPSSRDSAPPPARGGSFGPRGYGFQSAPSALQHMKIEQSNGGDVVMTSPGLTASPAPLPAPKGGAKSGLDGMSALLRAGEIVDRRGE